MDFLADVRVIEEFKRWSLGERMRLIEAIVNGHDWEFTGMDTVSIEKPDDM